MSIDNNVSYQFYKKYHQNKINKIIHILCIPLIVWSFSVLLNSFVFNIGLTFNNIQQDISYNFNFNIYLSFILLSQYLLFYTIIDINSFIPMFILLYFIWITSYYFFISSQYPYYYSLIINVFSWIMQFIGHGIFEGNRPALMDSIKQAFLMAPLFTYYELKQLITM